MRKTVQIMALVILTVLFFNPLQASGQILLMKDENIGKEAKNFTLKTIRGEENSLDELRLSENTIVFFWATWCPHCRVALSKLDKEKEDIKSSGINLILVDVGESEQVITKYMEKNKIDMDVLMDEKTEVSQAYGVVGLPTFCFIDKKGIVKDVLNGLPNDLEAIFE